jgi:hypothetical protein
LLTHRVPRTMEPQTSAPTVAGRERGARGAKRPRTAAHGPGRIRREAATGPGTPGGRRHRETQGATRRGTGAWPLSPHIQAVLAARPSPVCSWTLPAIWVVPGLRSAPGHRSLEGRSDQEQPSRRPRFRTRRRQVH